MPASDCHMGTWIKLRNGEQEALLELYNAHYLGLMNYGLKLTSDRNLTNESITQVLLRLWDNRGRLPEVENVRSYLMTCLRNEMLAQLKAEAKRLTNNQVVNFTADHFEPSYEEYLVAIQADEESKEKLHIAFEKLTGREKELLRMKFFEDLDYDEIASQCRITKRTAYNIIHAAVKTLKVELLKHREDRLEIKHLFVLLPFLIKNMIFP